MVQNIALDKAEFATCINGKLWFEGNYIFFEFGTNISSINQIHSIEPCFIKRINKKSILHIYVTLDQIE